MRFHNIAMIASTCLLGIALLAPSATALEEPPGNNLISVRTSMCLHEDSGGGDQHNCIALRDRSCTVRYASTNDAEPDDDPEEDDFTGYGCRAGSTWWGYCAWEDKDGSTQYDCAAPAHDGCVLRFAERNDEEAPGQDEDDFEGYGCEATVM